MSTTTAMTRVMACPEHAPDAGIPVPFDDGRGTCLVCGSTGYHVSPFDMPAGVLVGWAKWWNVTAEVGL